MNRRIAILLTIMAALFHASAQPASAQAQTGGAWREFWRHVFDANFRMQKERWYIWDDQPALNREPTWEGKMNARPAPEGHGILSWRKPGAASANGAGPVRRYIGEMKDGKRDGTGMLLPESGSRYEGQWQNDVQEGEGRYFFSNGDYYEGTFHLGEVHGRGTYATAAGEVYEGGFANDERHGKGRNTLSNGTAYDSEWVQGVETAASKAQRAALNAKGPSPGLRLMAIASSERHEKLRLANDEVAKEEILGYRSHVKDGAILIEPESVAYDFWKKHGWLKGEWDLATSPVMLDVTLFNNRTTPVNVVRGTVEVEKSRSDAEPFIETRTWAYMGKDFGSAAGAMDMMFVNLGWGAARNCVLEYNLSPKNSPPALGSFAFSRQLGDLGDRARVNFKEDFRSLGVDVATIERAFQDKDAMLVKPETATQVLGRFTQFDEKGKWVFSHARLDARLSYEWTDADGKPKKSSCTLDAEVLLDPRPLPEGGAPKMKEARFDLLLALDRDQYGLPFGYTSTVAPGNSARIAMNFSAPKSSYHRFKIVLVLSDGSTVNTLPFSLRYFAPRTTTKSVP